MKNKTKLKKVIVVRHAIYYDLNGNLNLTGMSLAKMLAVNIAQEVGNKKVVIWSSKHVADLQTAGIIQQHLPLTIAKVFDFITPPQEGNITIAKPMKMATSIRLVDELSHHGFENTSENADMLWEKFSECSEEVLIIVTHASYLVCMDTQWKLNCGSGFAAGASGFVLQWGETPTLLKQIAFDTTSTCDQKRSCWTTIKSILCTIGWVAAVVLFVLLVYRVADYLTR